MHQTISTIHTFVKKIFRTLSNTFFPQHCLACKRADELLCKTCSKHLARAASCTDPRIHACFSYKEKSLRRVLWKYKYESQKSSIKNLIPFLTEDLVCILDDLWQLDAVKDTILIPVPLSKARWHERGFNQSQHLAEHIALSDPNVFTVHTGILQKTKDTPQQMSIKNRAKRKQNIAGAFSLKSHPDLSLYHIVVVDDITTTGATIGEAFRVLESLHPRSLHAITIAH